MKPLPKNVVRTMCPMNCHPTLCGMQVEVRNGELIQVKGDKDNPDSQGFLCARGQASQEIIGNPKRLLYPLVRDRRGEDTWRQTSWDEALDLIAKHVNEVDREAVAIWPGHGAFANNMGLMYNAQLMQRFANLYGCQFWNAAMVCWGLGGFGLAMTGTLETNTKEDMGENANFVIMWGANLASQPNTASHLLAAKKRGARIISIDVRRTETCAQSDDVILIKPGTDAALALALMHVIINENLYDEDFVSSHTIGFDELSDHVQSFTPAWAADIPGIEASCIEDLARRYAASRPAMIVVGGSTIHKGYNSWHAARAIGCLPALTGNLGIAGGGFGPRHGSMGHGRGLGNVMAFEQRPPGNYVANQMSDVSTALNEGRVSVLMLMGSNMLTSFADAGQLAKGIERTDLVVSFDLFMNETARQFADVILPATAWLEELGCKATNSHLYLMEPALTPAGEARPLQDVLIDLADRLEIEGFYPWKSHENFIDAILNHPSSNSSTETSEGPMTVAKLRAQGGISRLEVPDVAYPTHHYQTPSGKVEFLSSRAVEMGLPPLPVYEEKTANSYPLILSQGRTLTQFNSFYDQGQALPMLAGLNPGPKLWIAPDDAAVRGLEHGAPILIYNQRGEFRATAIVTDKVLSGVVWIRHGWDGLNNLTSGEAVLPNSALNILPFTVGQSSYEVMVEVSSV